MDNNRRGRKVEVVRRGLLDATKREQMFATLIRNRQAFETVRGVLTKAALRSFSDAYALVWDVVCLHYDRFNALPKRSVLRAEVHNALNDNPDTLGDDGGREVDELLDYAWDEREHGSDLAYDKEHADYAIEACKQFMEEAIAVELTTVTGGGSVVIDLPRVLEESRTKLSQIQGLTEPAVDAVFTRNWDTQERTPLVPSRLPTLDEFLGGGQAAGECYVMMAPMGSCKTITACQATVLGAQAAAELYESGGSFRGLVPRAVFISTEPRIQEFRERTLAFAAQIPRTRLAAMRSLEDLCKDPLPARSKDTDYERKEFRQYFRDGRVVESEVKGDFMPEYERAKRAVNLINKHVLFIDFTDSNIRKRDAGAGGVEEAALVVHTEMRRYEHWYPSLFWVDHASALAMRMLAKRNQGHDELRHVLKDIPRLVRDLLAYPYRAPAWVLHQLSGEANSKGPVTSLNHTDAAECKMFAEQADFAIVAGSQTNDGLCVFEGTKHRRQPQHKRRPVEIDGAFNRIIDRYGDFYIDDGSKQIISKREAEGRDAYNRARDENAPDWQRRDGLSVEN